MLISQRTIQPSDGPIQWSATPSYSRYGATRNKLYRGYELKRRSKGGWKKTKKHKNMSDQPWKVDFVQTTCYWTFFYLSVIFPLSKLQDCRSIYKITNLFERSQIHFQDWKFIFKIANSFPRLQIHLQDQNSFVRLQIFVQDCNA